MISELTYLYALKDPTTGEQKYFGKSDNPVKRLGQHQKDADKNEGAGASGFIRACDGIPILEILAEVPKSCWQFFEQSVIYDAKESGAKLWNRARGGEGIALLGENNGRFGKPVSKETRDKIRIGMAGTSDGVKNGFFGKKHSESAKRAIGRANSGNVKEKNPFFGKKHDLESRKRMSASQKLRHERTRQKEIGDLSEQGEPRGR